MSWFSNLTSQAEAFLTNLDATTAQALKRDTGRAPTSIGDRDSHLRSDCSTSWNQDTLAKNYRDDGSVELGNTTSQTANRYPTASIVKSSDNVELTDAALFQFLNSPSSTDQPSCSSKSTHPPSHDLDDSVSSGYQTVSTTDSKRHTSAKGILSKGVGETKVSDLTLENKLLRSEISSMNQEVSNLLRRNHKASEEIKELTRQVDHLTNQLKESDNHVRELQYQSQIKAAAASQVEYVEQIQTEVGLLKHENESFAVQLESNKLAMTTMESELRAAKQQTVIAERRVELIQKENVCLTKELTQYKEKANQILAMKEKVIASLRGQSNSSDVPLDSDESQTELIDSIRAECDLLREEVAKWRLEVEYGEVAMQELEMQTQNERASWQKSMESYEQQLEREKRLHEDALQDLFQLRQRCHDLEQSLHRQGKAQIPLQSTQSGRSDISKHVGALESRVQQLTDNVMSKQDALESVLAQNHALKIRLERVQNDNESLATAISLDDTRLLIDGSRSIQTHGYGCSRLDLHHTPIPRTVLKFVYRVDNIGVRLANIFRHWPRIRIISMLYLLFLHVWLFLVYFAFAPN